MIRRYNNLSLALGVPGLILQIVGFVLQRSAGKEALGLVVALLGTALLVTGLGFYALSRGRNPAWCLLGLLGIIGLVALALLKDLEPERRRKKKKRPRRIDESEEYEQDRPRSGALHFLAGERSRYLEGFLAVGAFDQPSRDASGLLFPHGFLLCRRLDLRFVARGSRSTF
jgi:hypothetical protein